MNEKTQIDLENYDGEDRVISAQEMYLTLKNQPDSPIQVKSSIPSLDKAIGDFRGGELIAVSGPTKNGKTLLCQSLTVQFVKKLFYPLWFSFEVPAKQFLDQFHTLPMIYMPAKLKLHAVSWFEERALESFLKYNTRIIFIDHLHYLIDLAKNRNPSIEIGQVIRGLKTFAVERQFVIFLLCHTRKGSSEDGLSFESIRDSSFISQESDTVFMIKRTPDKGENRARLRVEFHRRTGVIEKVIELEKAKGYLAEYTESGEKGQ